MSQHNKIKVITKKYTLVFFLIGLSPPAVADQSSYKEKLKLEKIQSRMANVNKEIEKSKDKVKVLQKELNENELITTKKRKSPENT